MDIEKAKRKQAAIRRKALFADLSDAELIRITALFEAEDRPEDKRRIGVYQDECKRRGLALEGER